MFGIGQKIKYNKEQDKSTPKKKKNNFILNKFEL
jgi:hypothetical protein